VNRFSVIVPAHNEELVISRCLAGLASAGRAGEAHVVVVCNGCVDDTASQARAVGGWVTVIETPVASKPHALNLGDAAAQACFPRVYVDADVVLSSGSLGRLVRHLETEPALACAPSAQLNLSGASWAVRAFYSVDTQLPWSRQGIGGTGVYAVSQAGRQRFGEFPAITADDGFVRLHFRPSERQVVSGAYSIVTPPRNLSELIRIKTRSHYGKYELADRFPELLSNTGHSNRRALLRMAADPQRWPALTVYALVKAMARVRAKAQYRRGGVRRWERDETSREQVTTPVLTTA
jgi:glycosyltransferase involved in cell wall biosynthesis